MITISFHTLGCKMNQAETYQMQEDVSSLGIQMVNFKNKCDISVLNTCTVTQLADKKSRQLARSLLKRSKFLILTGCYVNISAELDEFINNPQVYILEDKTKIKKTISLILSNNLNSDKAKTTDNLYNNTQKRYRANLIIQNGCNNFCSYCIVPYVRGREISYSKDILLKQAKDLANKGIKEIILTGINTGANKNLVDIIKEISKLKDILRIRISSIEPLNISDELINEISTNDKLCKHLHIPLQSGDDNVLKNMDRKYSSSDYKNIVCKIRNKIPNIAVSTDIIVGFPGETENQFFNTVNFCNDIKFSRLHIFRFSARPNTKAFLLKNKISKKTISQRAAIMRETRKILMLDFHKKFIYAEKDVLIEGFDTNKQMLEGLTSEYIRVFVKGNKSLIGKISKVKIENIFEEYVIGKIANNC